MLFLLIGLVNIVQASKLIRSLQHSIKSTIIPLVSYRVGSCHDYDAHSLLISFESLLCLDHCSGQLPGMFSCHH